jgi:hypothetical protein
METACGDGVLTPALHLYLDGSGSGHHAAFAWGRTPSVILRMATVNISSKTADHADFKTMMREIGVENLISQASKKKAYK